MLIDTHCHLDFPDFDNDRDQVLARAKDNGVGFIINIGSSLENSRSSLELARKYDFIYAAVGIHPHEADSFSQEGYEEIKKIAKENKVVAIGEIGLDYFKNFSKEQNQQRQFHELAGLAKELRLPIVIHCRQAQREVLETLKPIMPHKIVVHCFSGDRDFLKHCLELGFFVSFTLNITYKKAQELRKLVEVVPMDRLFLETDAPFLPPEGMRGKRNEPALVKKLAEEISKIKGISFQQVEEATTLNAKEFFNLP
ncbi:MAG: TatD family hydrolase [Candidatus Omnitrophica bacterium]|nr:TatD family hydrolase [Candidatus Omnitrophota bacterium]